MTAVRSDLGAEGVAVQAVRVVKITNAAATHGTRTGIKDGAEENPAQITAGLKEKVTQTATVGIISAPAEGDVCGKCGKGNKGTKMLTGDLKLAICWLRRKSPIQKTHDEVNKEVNV